MKYYLFSVVFFVSALGFFSCKGEKTEESLAREVFQAFVDDDAVAFKRLYVTQMDIESIISHSSIPADMRNNARKKLRLQIAFWRTISKAGFNTLRFASFEKGVNWQNSEIVSIESAPSNYGFFGFDRLANEKYGIQVKDIDITFVSDKDTFLMQLDDCIKTNGRGWCMTEDVRIRRKNFYD